MGFSWAICRFILKVHCVVVVLLLLGCGSLKNFADTDSACESQPPVEGATGLSLFFNVHRQDARPNLNVKINSIELLVDDLWVPVPSKVSEVNSVEAVPVQRFLGRQWLKGRYCRGIRLKVSAVTLSRSTGDQALPVMNSEAEVMLQDPVELAAGSRRVLLLEWDPEKSLSAAGFEGMALTAFGGGVARITANLTYVTCPEIDTVYVVRTDRFQVVDAFAVNGKPTYLAVAPDNKSMYVLASALNKIIPYDISTNLPGSEIQIPLANSPIFMAVNISSQVAYVLDAQGVLTSIDLVSGNMLYRNRIGNRPNYLHYLARQNKLAVSSTFDQTVYLVNPDGLAVEDYVSLGAAPLGLGSWQNYLYIAEGSANTVSVYDLNARKMLKNVHVGFEPGRFITSDSSIYVSNYLDGTLAIMPGGQFSVSKEVAVGKSAGEMAVAEKQRLLFVGVGDCDGSLAVLDTTGNRVIGRIELGAKPLGIAVLE